LTGPKLVEPEVVATSPGRGKNPVPVCGGFDSHWKSSKFQAPTSRETSILKLQRSSRSPFDCWCLAPLWSLVLGIWNFNKWWVATVPPRAPRFKRPLHRCNACNPKMKRTKTRVALLETG